MPELNVPPPAPRRSRYSWEMIDPRDVYVILTRTGLTLSAAAVSRIQTSRVAIMVDRTAGAIGIKAAAADSPYAISMQPIGKNAKVAIPALAGMVALAPTRGGRRLPARWDKDEQALVVSDVPIVSGTPEVR